MLSHVLWDEDAARDLCRDYVVEHLGAEDGVLVVDETGFLKKGEHSAGVARQYCGTAGRIENGQVGVFLAYASGKGHALIDRELYLPEAWGDDAESGRRRPIPDEVAFATKPALAGQMIGRALDAGLPCAWVLGDEMYGSDRRLRMDAGAARAALRAGHPQQREAVGGAGRASRAARRRTPGRQPAGPSLAAALGGRRQQGRAALRLGAPAPDPAAAAALGALAAGPAQLQGSDGPRLLRRLRPCRTTLATLAQVAGRRWAIEECFEVAKQEVGLADYEVRCWHGWYRHITLAMLAFGFLAGLRVKLNAVTSHKRGRRSLELWSPSAWARSASSLAACNVPPA